MVKIASAVPTNRQHSASIGNGGILICSAITGEPLAFLADEDYLTDARTAAAGALATDLMAAPDAATLTVLGAGVLGEIISGEKPSRTRPEDVTIAKLTGVAAQDLAAARVVLDRLDVSR